MINDIGAALKDVLVIANSMPNNTLYVAQIRQKLGDIIDTLSVGTELQDGEVFDLFKNNCVHYAGNYEVTPGQALRIAGILTSKADAQQDMVDGAGQLPTIEDKLEALSEKAWKAANYQRPSQGCNEAIREAYALGKQSHAAPDGTLLSEVWMVSNKTTCAIFANEEFARDVAFTGAASTAGGMRVERVPIIGSRPLSTRDAVLEAAAKECENLGYFWMRNDANAHYQIAVESCAKAIRAMQIQPFKLSLTEDEIKQLALDDWKASNTWNLSRDDFIRLSYFHGCMERGSDGKGPINGSEDRPEDVVYIAPNGSVLTRSMVSYWFNDSNSFIHGYQVACRRMLAR